MIKNSQDFVKGEIGIADSMYKPCLRNDWRKHRKVPQEVSIGFEIESKSKNNLDHTLPSEPRDRITYVRVGNSGSYIPKNPNKLLVFIIGFTENSDLRRDCDVALARLQLVFN